MLLTFLRQPFLELGFGVCEPRIIGEVLPLMRVPGGIVEFFTAIAIADVVPVPRADGVVVPQTDQRRIRPLGFRVAKQRCDTAPVQPVPLRQSRELDQGGIQIHQADRLGASLAVRFRQVWGGDDEWCLRSLLPERQFGDAVFLTKMKTVIAA